MFAIFLRVSANMRANILSHFGLTLMNHKPLFLLTRWGFRRCEESFEREKSINEKRAEIDQFQRWNRFIKLALIKIIVLLLCSINLSSCAIKDLICDIFMIASPWFHKDFEMKALRQTFVKTPFYHPQQILNQSTRKLKWVTWKISGFPVKNTIKAIDTRAKENRIRF